jgi:hypothetical protein
MVRYLGVVLTVGPKGLHLLHRPSVNFFCELLLFLAIRRVTAVALLDAARDKYAGCAILTVDVELTFVHTRFDGFTILHFPLTVGAKSRICSWISIPLVCR